MKAPAPADLQRWSDELARNPASLAFLPLARAYRRQGRIDLAMRICLRGLEQHPMHVEAHALLALLYLETGDRAKAADEWATVLRLKPGNFEALRGMGFRYLEQADIPRARQHLERAALIRPTDSAVQEALRLIRAREQAALRIQTSKATPPRDPGVGAEVQDSPEASAQAQVSTEAASGAQAQAQAEVGVREAGTAGGVPTASMQPAEGSSESGFEDPSRLFDPLLRSGPVLGALLLDGRGLVLAGRLAGQAAERSDEVGALMGGLVEEVGRTVRHLQLTGWRGLVLECGTAMVHVSPAGDDGALALVVRRDAPRGWVLRSASAAGSLAERFLGSYA